MLTHSSISTCQWPILETLSQPNREPLQAGQKPLSVDIQTCRNQLLCADLSCFCTQTCMQCTTLQWSMQLQLAGSFLEKNMALFGVVSCGISFAFRFLHKDIVTHLECIAITRVLRRRTRTGRKRARNWYKNPSIYTFWPVTPFSWYHKRHFANFSARDRRLGHLPISRRAHCCHCGCLGDLKIFKIFKIF